MSDVGADLTGAVIDRRFTLSERLATGRSGTTYAAQDRRLGEAALLTFFDYLAESSRWFLPADIKGELKSVAGLDTPNIVTPYAYGLYESVPYMVSAAHEGQPLSGEASVAPLALARVIHVGREICLALADLHQALFLHGALNSSSVILVPTPDFPWVRLTGFGPRAARMPVASQERFGAELPYLAPEQLGDRPVGVPADLYSVGVILFELATGQLPLTTEQLTQVNDGNWPALTTAMTALNYYVPTSLEALTMALLRYNPDERPQTAAEVAAQLAQIGQNDLISPDEPPRPVL